MTQIDSEILKAALPGSRIPNSWKLEATRGNKQVFRIRKPAAVDCFCRRTVSVATHQFASTGHTKRRLHHESPNQNVQETHRFPRCPDPIPKGWV